MADKPPITKDTQPGNQASKKNIPTGKLRGKKSKGPFNDSFPSELAILKNFAQTTSDIFFVLNLKGKKIEYINPAVKSILKVSEPEFHEIEEIFLSLFPQSDYQALIKTLKCSTENMLNAGCAGKGELEVRIKDCEGSILYFTLTYTFVSEAAKAGGTLFLCQCRNITSTKEYVKELQHNRLKLQMALDGSNMGVWSYDPMNRIFECDERTNQIFGVTNNELKQEVNPYFLKIHPEDRALAILTAFSTLRQKGRFNHEFRVIHTGSKLMRHVALLGEFIHDEKSNITKVTGVCTDITHHKLAENKLKTNETFLEESQRIARIGCFDWDITLDKITLTGQMYHLLGSKSEEEINLKQFYSNVHPDDLPGVQKVLINTLKLGKNFSHEFRYLGKNLKERFFWVQGQAVQSQENRTIRLLGSMQDISERKEKEKEIHTQNLIIRSMLAHLPVVILMVDKAGIIRSLLGSGLNNIGLEENETVGKSIFEQNPPVGKHIRQVLQGKSLHFTEELEVNGQLLHFLSYYFFDKERELAIGFSIDITSQRATEEALQQVSIKNMELERINHLMDMFVYAVAHDLKNPVNNLEMLSNLITEASSPEERSDYLKALEKSVSRLKRTIKGLTEVVELENHRNLQAQRIKFEKILNQVKEEVHPLLKEKNVKLDTDLKQAHITYNEAFLRSILGNLLSNALKYSHPDRPSHIQISTCKENGYVLLIVSDNGIGMDLKVVEDRLFMPFKRFTKQAEGTGIGLHLVKNIVEKNGGYIRVESTPDMGSTFKCYLLPYKRNA